MTKQKKNRFWKTETNRKSKNNNKSWNYISFEKNLQQTWTKKYFLGPKKIICNEFALFGMKLKYVELKFIKRNVPGVSLWGMSLSIEKI